jgi:hypothetical protein
MGEPTRLGHHEVEMIAVDDKVAAAVRALVDGALAHLDAAEMGAVIVAQELVVIAGHVDETRALARLAKQLLRPTTTVRTIPQPITLLRGSAGYQSNE